MATETSNPPLLLEAPLPKDVLSSLYQNMLKARLVTKRWPRASRISEAVVAGALLNLEDGDVLVSAGTNPVLVTLKRESSATAPVEKHESDGNATDVQNQVIAVGDRLATAIAAGIALGLKRAQSNAAVLTYIDGRMTRGKAWEEALQFASSYRLPVVFIADSSNGRSPRKHEGRDLSHWPCPTIAVDGRDVIAVYRVTKEAISAARRGHGPTVVDCISFLAPGRRGVDERDPLATYRGYLKRHNAWSDEWYQSLEERLKEELGIARKSRGTRLTKKNGKG
jgi:hypothetical protein